MKKTRKKHRRVTIAAVLKEINHWEEAKTVAIKAGNSVLYGQACAVVNELRFLIGD